MQKPDFHPESLMMSHGYKPALSEGAVKPPVFMTSTFVFNSAEEGKAFFELAYGLREKQRYEEPGLIYSRINNPNLEILENRLCLWDKADDCAVFESGMAAISTVLMEFLSPGDLLVYSVPVYGGTHHFIEHFLHKIGIETLGFSHDMDETDLATHIQASGKADRLAMIYLESPANPTNDLFDIEMCRRVADHFSTEEKRVLVSVDNTYMGPVWSHPLQHGADVVLYSATKYIGGHSDVIAGAALGRQEVVDRIKTLRTFLGNMASPHTAWLLMRSLETLSVRMERQMENARKVARFLQEHPAVERVHYLEMIERGTRAYGIYQRQYASPGAMISFEVKGGEAEAFKVLNRLKLIKLAVSLGSTESLAQHPASMTHVGIPEAERMAMGITSNLIRLSVGVERDEDIIADLAYGLKALENRASDAELKGR